MEDKKFEVKFEICKNGKVLTKVDSWMPCPPIKLAEIKRAHTNCPQGKWLSILTDKYCRKALGRAILHDADKIVIKVKYDKRWKQVGVVVAAILLQNPVESTIRLLQQLENQGLADWACSQ